MGLRPSTATGQWDIRGGERESAEDAGALGMDGEWEGETGASSRPSSPSMPALVDARNATSPTREGNNPDRQPSAAASPWALYTPPTYAAVDPPRQLPRVQVEALSTPAAAPAPEPPSTTPGTQNAALGSYNLFDGPVRVPTLPLPLSYSRGSGSGIGGAEYARPSTSRGSDARTVNRAREAHDGLDTLPSRMYGPPPLPTIDPPALFPDPTSRVGREGNVQGERAGEVTTAEFLADSQPIMNEIRQRHGNREADGARLGGTPAEERQRCVPQGQNMRGCTPGLTRLGFGKTKKWSGFGC